MFNVPSLYSLCHRKMFKERYRVQTFKNWSVNWKLHPYKMWSNGYFYCGKLNKIQCAFCFVQLYNITNKFDFLWAHEPFCRAFKIYNVYFDLDYEKLCTFYNKINDETKYVGKYNKWERSIIWLQEAVKKYILPLHNYYPYNSVSDSDSDESDMSVDASDFEDPIYSTEPEIQKLIDAI